jgi:hypothetical protein
MKIFENCSGQFADVDLIVMTNSLKILIQWDW